MSQPTNNRNITNQPGGRAGLLGALLLAALSTAGDWIWAQWIPRHTAVYGITHGAILFLFLGGYLGWTAGGARRCLTGAAGGLAIGVVAAASFYPLALLLRFAAMFPIWFAVWILLGWWHGHLHGGTPLRDRLLRGGVAAIGSGIAFYAISGIWTQPNPAGPNYLLHFASWTVAFLPGFLALYILWRRA